MKRAEGDVLSLEELKAVQQECARKVVRKDDFDSLKTIGGMDVTFEDLKSNPTRAWASLVVLEFDTLKEVYSLVVEDTVTFPYIPTFLAFREMPLLLKLYERAQVKPDLFMIDGQGVAHPRRCGIASHFGIETGEVSIGVAKSRLFGRYEEPGHERGSFSYLVHKGDTVGVVLRTRNGVKPVFVSVGHRISLNTAISVVLRSSRFRVPEPTRLAHNLLQKVRRENLGGAN